MQLYDKNCQRLYLNAEERRRFLSAAVLEPAEQRTFCLTLFYTGCRVSEAITLTHVQVQTQARILTLRTLKRRDQRTYREVPIPQELVDELKVVFPVIDAPMDPPSVAPRPLWQHQRRAINRSTAYRWVKGVMRRAGIHGAQATCKGLRHGYGIHATQTGVQLHMLQKWMGHARMETTAIYATAIGTEEQQIAQRMWRVE